MSLFVRIHMINIHIVVCVCRPIHAGLISSGQKLVKGRIGLRQIHGEVTDFELQQLHNEISTQSLLLNNIR